jgi:tetratricopeptide (TPR) repeat protein
MRKAPWKKILLCLGINSLVGLATSNAGMAAPFPGEAIDWEQVSLKEPGYKEVPASCRITEAKEFSDPQRQVDWLVGIANQHPNNLQQKDVIASLTSATKVATRISNSTDRAITLTNIAVTYTKVGMELGRNNQVGNLLNQALAVIRTVPNKHCGINCPQYQPFYNPQVLALSLLAEGYARVGMHDQVLKITSSFPLGGLDTPDILSRVAVAYAKTGQPTLALKTIQGVYGSSQPKVQEDVAFTYAEAQKYTLAIETAKSIKDPLYQGMAFLEIAQQYIKKGKSSEAANVLPLALDAAQSMNVKGVFELDRWSLLARIASAYAQVERFDQALKISQTITKPPLRASALALVAAELMKHGQKQRGKELFRQSIAIVNAYEPTQVRVLAAITVTYADAGLFEDAIQLANSFQETTEKLRLSPSELAKAPEDDLYSFESVDPSRSLLLSEIALRLIHDRQIDRALTLTKGVQPIPFRDKVFQAAINHYSKVKEYKKALVVANQLADKENRERWLRLLNCADSNR